MNNIEIKEFENTDIVSYLPSGVCSRCMNLQIKDNIILDAEFIGGCNGNLKGIRSLIIGSNINDIEQKLNGICCGDKATSCPDQLSKCIAAYKQAKSNILANAK